MSRFIYHLRYDHKEKRENNHGTIGNLSKLQELLWNPQSETTASAKNYQQKTKYQLNKSDRTNKEDA